MEEMGGLLERPEDENTDPNELAESASQLALTNEPDRTNAQIMQQVNMSNVRDIVKGLTVHE